MSHTSPQRHKLRVCAVSYLNTVPLVWGMLHGDQRGLFDLAFCLPSECADRLESGEADIGIVPAAELPRLRLEMIPGIGIASRGPVRSILLISKVPLAGIRLLAADTSSRTSIRLARILLALNHGVRPRLLPCKPDLPAMLDAADAAVIIGDPALRTNLEKLPCLAYDLGAQWTETTGLPMVYAVWAGRKEVVTPGLTPPFLESCRFGLAHIEDIVRLESVPRGLTQELVRDYFTRCVTLEFGRAEYRGLELFLRYTTEFGMVEQSGAAQAC